MANPPPCSLAQRHPAGAAAAGQRPAAVGGHAAGRPHRPDGAPAQAGPAPASPLGGGGCLFSCCIVIDIGLRTVPISEPTHQSRSGMGVRPPPLCQEGGVGPPASHISLLCCCRVVAPRLVVPLLGRRVTPPTIWLCRVPSPTPSPQLTVYNKPHTRPYNISNWGVCSVCTSIPAAYTSSLQIQLGWVSGNGGSRQSLLYSHQVTFLGVIRIV